MYPLLIQDIKASQGMSILFDLKDFHSFKVSIEKLVL